ncbi:late competence protein ComER [Siminovitchia sp. 179-K 8D1 HS]|uniref:late competence protein ComER n=1 Tax=Siminovitchia sp. 179-K 8D1 HS TaxID=3142385 RepID=UPI00399F5D86
MKVGIIGTGNMGTILTEALINGGAVSPSELIITNRTIGKAYKLQTSYEEITVAQRPDEVINEAKLIFICVKPLDIVKVIQENRKFFTGEKCLVSITSPIEVKWLEKSVASSCARVIPSITNRALSGVSLLTFGEGCKDPWRVILKEMFSKVSVPVEIDESIVRVASDIVSCGPAFYCYLTRKLIDAAVKETNIDEKTATILSESMLAGLGELLKKGYYSLPALQEKVCVKGGITGEGIDVLQRETGDMFEKLFRATHKKFAAEADVIEKAFFS